MKQKDKKQFYKINEFAKEIGFSAQTLRNWHKNGYLIPAIITEHGYRIYTRQQLIDFITKYRGK